LTWPDLTGRAALITGGTRGLGLAIGKALGKHGATAWLTHRWGTAVEEEVLRDFASVGAPPPRLQEADVAHDEDTDRLMEAIAIEHEAVDVFVSNACVVGRGGSLDRLTQRDFLRALDYSAWPLLRYLDRIEARFGALPRYVIATSSDGVARHYPDYDYVALSKAALESLAVSLAARVAGTGTRVFVLRTRHMTTEGFAEIFPEDARRLLDRFSSFALQPDDAGDAAIALVSGLMDGLHGQILSLDRGAEPLDNTMTVGPILLGP